MVACASSIPRKHVAAHGVPTGGGGAGSKDCKAERQDSGSTRPPHNVCKRFHGFKGVQGREKDGRVRWTRGRVKEGGQLTCKIMLCSNLPCTSENSRQEQKCLQVGCQQCNSFMPIHELDFPAFNLRRSIWKSTVCERLPWNARCGWPTGSAPVPVRPVAVPLS